MTAELTPPLRLSGLTVTLGADITALTRAMPRCGRCLPSSRWRVSRDSRPRIFQGVAAFAVGRQQFPCREGSEEDRQRCPIIAFVGLTGGHTSAWCLGEDWVEGLTTPPGEDVEDFICLAACELWKRFCPEHPSVEMVDEWVTEGDELFEANKQGEALDIWLRVWEHVRLKIEPCMTTYSDADAVFGISQFFGNWIADLTMAIGNESTRNEKYTDIGIRLIGEVLHQFVDESLNAVLNRRCDLGRLLCRAGRREEGLATWQTIISEHPEQSCGYVELAEELGRTAQADADIPRAIALLEQALAYPVVDAADWDLEYRLADLRQELAGVPRCHFTQ